MEVFKTLQKHPTCGTFFCTFDDGEEDTSHSNFCFFGDCEVGANCKWTFINLCDVSEDDATGDDEDNASGDGEGAGRPTLVMGEKFAEGAQAELYEAQVKSKELGQYLGGFCSFSQYRRRVSDLAAASSL